MLKTKQQSAVADGRAPKKVKTVPFSQKGDGNCFLIFIGCGVVIDYLEKGNP